MSEIIFPKAEGNPFFFQMIAELPVFIVGKILLSAAQQHLVFLDPARRPAGQAETVVFYYPNSG